MDIQEIENRLNVICAAERLKNVLRSAHTSNGRQESIAYY